jgi:hypothetical protein
MFGGQYSSTKFSCKARLFDKFLAQVIESYRAKGADVPRLLFLSFIKEYVSHDLMQIFQPIYHFFFFTLEKSYIRDISNNAVSIGMDVAANCEIFVVSANGLMTVLGRSGNKTNAIVADEPQFLKYLTSVHAHPYNVRQMSNRQTPPANASPTSGCLAFVGRKSAGKSAIIDALRGTLKTSEQSAAKMQGMLFVYLIEVYLVIGMQEA